MLNAQPHYTFSRLISRDLVGFLLIQLNPPGFLNFFYEKTIL
jgi:hypothetical protein